MKRHSLLKRALQTASLPCCPRLKGFSFGLCLISALIPANSPAQATRWQPTGISGGGGMFAPAISPANSNLMMLNCDMSAAYLSEDGGHNWRMIHHAQLRSDTACRPVFRFIPEVCSFGWGG